MEESKEALLDVRNFSLHFKQFKKGLKETETLVIRNFNLSIFPGEIVAVVGASGSGKSLLADSILGITPENAVPSGELYYKGELLTRKKQEQLRGKEITLIPQSVAALDPMMRTDKQVQSMVQGSKREQQEKQAEIFNQLHLQENTGNLYPFELSGGMSRRVLAATSIVSDSNLIIADEPTPGLDPVSLQETVQQMKQLVTKDKGMMFITHDIEVALQIADKIAVFYEGETVDIVDVSDFTGAGERLTHPYTKALWNSLPKNEFFEAEAVQSTTLAESESIKIQQSSSENLLGPLEVKQISYQYNKNESLFDNFNLTVNPGEVVGIYGPSGTGKSTMAQIISGHRDIQEGSVTVNGKVANKNQSHPVQLILQHPEKAINPRWRMQQMFNESETFHPTLMQAMRLKEEWLSRWPSELSGGELQRFSVARALNAPNVRYLIADEMTTMLDAITQAQIWDALLHIIKEKQIGIVAISHDYPLLERIADRIEHFKPQPI